VEVAAAVAIGLNPYVGAFVLAALAAFTTHVPSTGLLAVVPGWMVTALAALFGVMAPIDLIFGKLHRSASVLRRLSQAVALVAGGFFATAVAAPEWPLPLAAAVGSFVAWGVASMLSTVAERASRSPAWVGYGHVPVLMAAATGAACIVPLAVARPVVGAVAGALALVVLVWSTVALQLRAHRSSAVRRPAIARRAQLPTY
jgi:hypothetical protein